MATKNGQWWRITTYGGKQTENAIQATSREVLKAAERRAKAAGFPLILDVYDELVAEVSRDTKEHTAEAFLEIVQECPGDWARGWPIRAEVWKGPRYRK